MEVRVLLLQLVELPQGGIEAALALDGVSIRISDGLPKNRRFWRGSYWVQVNTDLLCEDLPLEDVQYLAGHTNLRTTQTCGRQCLRVSRNIVKRIAV